MKQHCNEMKILFADSGTVFVTGNQCDREKDPWVKAVICQIEICEAPQPTYLLFTLEHTS